MIRPILYTTKLVRCRTDHVRHRTEKSRRLSRYWPPVPQPWQTTARAQEHVFDGPIPLGNDDQSGQESTAFCPQELWPPLTCRDGPGGFDARFREGTCRY